MAEGIAMGKLSGDINFTHKPLALNHTAVIHLTYNNIYRYTICFALYNNLYLLINQISTSLLTISSLLKDKFDKNNPLR